MKKLSKTVLIGVILSSFLMLFAIPAIGAVLDKTGTVIDPPSPTTTAVDCSQAGETPTKESATITTLCNVLKIVNILIFIFQLLAILYFIMTVVKYITAGGEPEAIKEAGQSILKSIVALGALFGAQLIINAIGKLAGIEGADSVIDIPFFSGF